MVKDASFNAFRRMGKGALDAIPEILKLTNHSDPYIREEAAITLSDMAQYGEKDKIIEALKIMLGDHNPYVAEAAKEALKKAEAE